MPTVGYAQILEAFELSKPERRDTAARIARGLRSVSIGNASESYDTARNLTTPETFGVALFSIRAYQLLRPYIVRMAAIR